MQDAACSVQAEGQAWLCVKTTWVHHGAACSSWPLNTSPSAAISRTLRSPECGIPAAPSHAKQSEPCTPSWARLEPATICSTASSRAGDSPARQNTGTSDARVDTSVCSLVTPPHHGQLRSRALGTTQSLAALQHLLPSHHTDLSGGKPAPFSRPQPGWPPKFQLH